MRARIHGSRRLGAGAPELVRNESVAAVVLGQDGNGGFGGQTSTGTRGRNRGAHGGLAEKPNMLGEASKATD